jgi:hypothetical protein
MCTSSLKNALQNFQPHSRPYIIVEIPANLLLRKIGPSLLMPTLVTIWGIIVTLQGQYTLGGLLLYISTIASGFVTSYAGLATARMFLGMVEGPMAPAIVLYLSGFYTRKELSLRYEHESSSTVHKRQLTIDHLELPYFLHQPRCVMKSTVRHF